MKLRLSQLRHMIAEAVQDVLSETHVTFGRMPPPPTEDDIAAAEHYRSWISTILKEVAAPGVYLRFDEQPFEASRSFGEENPNDHDNHLGIWTYMTHPNPPSSDSFGWGDKHVTILVPVGRILRTDKYTESDLEVDLKKLARKYGEGVVKDWADFVPSAKAAQRKTWAEYKSDYSDEEQEYVDHIEYRMSDASTTPAELLDGVATAFAKTMKNFRAGQSQLYTELGYSVIEDPLGIIDTHGDTALGLTRDSMRVVKRFVYQGRITG